LPRLLRHWQSHLLRHRCNLLLLLALMAAQQLLPPAVPLRVRIVLPHLTG
jgi:hypothetical protein